jgi:mono/diheme cytochrome c family protein
LGAAVSISYAQEPEQYTPNYRKRRGLPPRDEGAFQLETMGRVTVVLAILLCAGTVACNWEAPQSAKDVKNPVPPSAHNSKQAKSLFNGNCAICHGETGRGDGPIAQTARPSLQTSRTANSWTQKPTGRSFGRLRTGMNLCPDGTACYPRRNAGNSSTSFARSHNTDAGWRTPRYAFEIERIPRTVTAHEELGFMWAHIM